MAQVRPFIRPPYRGRRFRLDWSQVQLVLGAIIAVCAVVLGLSRGEPNRPLRAETATHSFYNCAEARAAGVAPMHMSHPQYSAKLDRDGDGWACEPYMGSD